MDDPRCPTPESRLSLGWSREQLIAYGNRHMLRMTEINWAPDGYVELSEESDSEV